MKNNQPGMTIIVKTVTKLTFGLILAFGFYIAVETRTGPGSGFAAGVIIALSLVLLTLAFGIRKAINKIDEVKGLILASLGGLVFLLITVSGFKGKSVSAGVMLLSDLALALMVGAGLFTVFLALILWVGAQSNR